jgi:tetratricopeptide (TPR) repeat protein
LSGDRAAPLVFRSHLLEARYFGVDELVQLPMKDLVGEFGLVQHPFLSDKFRQFLVKLRPAVEQGWVVLEQFPIDYPYNEENFKLTRIEIDVAVQICLERPKQLDGLAKFAALVYQLARCVESHRLECLKQAEMSMEQLLDPDDTEFSGRLYLGGLGRHINRLGFQEQAIMYCDKAIEIKPDLYDAWHNRGASLASLGRYEEAIASYDKATEIKPELPHIWHSRGVSLFSLGRYEEAISSYEKSIELNSKSHRAWGNRGIALSALGRKEEAIASYDKSLEIQPDSHVSWLLRGGELSDLDRTEEAITSYEKAVAIDPDNSDAYRNTGVLYYSLGQAEKAYVNFEILTENEPKDPHNWNTAAYLLLAEETYGIIPVFEKPLAIRPSLNPLSPTDELSQPLQARYHQALTFLNQAITLDPTMALAWGNRSFPLYRLGDLLGALDSCEQAIQQGLNDEVNHSNRGLILLRLQRLAEAQTSFEAALTLEANYPDAHYGLACAHALIGQPDLALEHLQKAIDLNPDHYRTLAQTDSDFDSLRQGPRFQQLLAPEA